MKKVEACFDRGVEDRDSFKQEIWNKMIPIRATRIVIKKIQREGSLKEKNSSDFGIHNLPWWCKEEQSVVSPNSRRGELIKREK